jgi:hypothetical protein
MQNKTLITATNISYPFAAAVVFIGYISARLQDMATAGCKANLPRKFI